MLDALLQAAVVDTTESKPIMLVNEWRDSGHSIWDKTPRWIRDLGECIRRHESWNIGMYTAQNPVSTASGAYQFLDSTWQGNAQWAKFGGEYVARGYVKARHAPPGVQDIVFVHSIQHGGIRAWHGTGCEGT